jgi:hypothetical protein
MARRRHTPPHPPPESVETTEIPPSRPGTPVDSART